MIEKGEEGVNEASVYAIWAARGYFTGALLT